MNWPDDYMDKVICGDCLEVMRDMPDNCVDLVLTDPPYGTENLAGGYGRRQLHDIGDGKGRVINKDTDLTQISLAYCNFHRLLGGCGWALIFYSARKTVEFIDATSKEEWFGHIIWDKGQPGLGFHIRYSHEDIAVFKIGNPERPKKPILSVLRNTILEHPHEKPVSVLKKLVEWGCPENGIVLDPFAGSGTTAAACIAMGRHYIGIEISEDYCEIARKRIQAEKDKYGLFES